LFPLNGIKQLVFVMEMQCVFRDFRVFKYKCELILHRLERRETVPGDNR
jgi:hypothetical protein